MSWKRKGPLEASLALLMVYALWPQIFYSVKHFSESEGSLQSPAKFFSNRNSTIEALHEKSNGTKETMEELGRRHAYRKMHVMKTCASHSTENAYWQTIMSQNLTIEDIELLNKIIVDDEHEILYCYVPKAACTSWKTFMIMLTKKADTTDPNLVPPEIIHKFETFRRLSSYTLPEIQKRLSHFVKFVFVRHPLSRILSAYRDKFENSNPSASNFFHQTYGREIVRLYRPNASEHSLRFGNDVKFSEFVKYLTDPLATVENGLFDEHWAPIVDLCMPCKINYDIIGKYETFDQDVWYVMEKSKIGHRIKFPPWKLSGTTASLLQQYLNQLSYSETRALYRLYRDDLKVFGYDT